jgi:hypothetical protein
MTCRDLLKFLQSLPEEELDHNIGFEDLSDEVYEGDYEDAKIIIRDTHYQIGDKPYISYILRR